MLKMGARDIAATLLMKRKNMEKFWQRLAEQKYKLDE